MVQQFILFCSILIVLAACNGSTTPPAVIANTTPVTFTRPTTTVTAQAQSTATPRPVTPIASPTPTITPTPIVYVVQPGDTLLKIAIQFDRSTDVIQEANGIVDPRFLQIGQELVIPPPQLDPESPPTPTPTPPPLTVQAVNFLQTAQGDLWSLGEVNNPGAEPLTEVVIEAALFDGAGALLARGAAFTQLDVVLPDQPVPFSIQFDTPPDEFAQYHVVAVSGVPLSGQSRYYFDLAAEDVSGAPEGFTSYRLTGNLRNTGPADAELIRLVAAVYDAQNRLLAQRQAVLDVIRLKAGAITPFDLELIVPQGVVDHYRVLAQGLKAP